MNQEVHREPGYIEVSDPAVMKFNPVVSVHMITYNHAPYIAQAIEGVLQQKTNFPFELVIGEDGSTDTTQQIVFEYQKRHPNLIRVITSDKNVGMTKNSYRTMKACRGKYIAFCEGDDYWHSDDKLQKQVEYMEIHQDCGAIFTDFDTYFYSSNEIKKRCNYHAGFQLPVDFFTIEEFIGGSHAREITCTFLVRKAFCEQVIEKDPYLHQSGHFLMNDIQLWAELALISKLSYIPEFMATYRIVNESASNSKDVTKVMRFWKSDAEMRLYLCNKHNLSETLRKNIESTWRNISLRLAFYERNADLALKVKEMNQKFTWKEWIRYLGARNLVFNYVYYSLALIHHLFMRKRA